MVDFKIIQAQRRWLYLASTFFFNVKHDFIQEAWIGDDHMINHLTEKLKKWRDHFGTPHSPQALAYFIRDLNDNNLKILQKYIEQNAETYN